MNHEDTAALIVYGIVWLEVSVYLVGDSVFFIVLLYVCLLLVDTAFRSSAISLGARSHAPFMRFLQNFPLPPGLRVLLS